MRRGGSVTSPLSSSSGGTSPSVSGGAVGGGPKWKKVMYERQLFPDNYTDPSFLIALKTNANFQPYEFWEMVERSVGVQVQLTICVFFSAVFWFCYAGDLGAPQLLALDVLLVVVGFALRCIALPPDVPGLFVKSSAKSCGLFVAFLWGLTPPLATLTQAYSDDTVAALVIMLLLTSCLTFDYAYVSTSDPATGHARSAGAVSLNAAMFASVILASRMPNDLLVFAFVQMAIILYAWSPILRHFLKNYWRRLYHGLAGATTLICLVLLYKLSITLMISYAAVSTGIVALAPATLLAIQQYKNEIHGPWDEAKPGLLF